MGGSIWAARPIGELQVQVNGGDARLDLSETTVTSIDLAVRAGSATVLLPSGSDLVGDLEASAGTIEICAPPGLGVRVRDADADGDVPPDDGSIGDRIFTRIANDILADVEADMAASEFNGLVRVGDAWETPDYSTATHQAELSVVRTGW